MRVFGYELRDLPYWRLALLPRPGGFTCLAFGGRFGDGRARVCEKPRWHTDSHAYGLLNNDGTVSEHP